MASISAHRPIFKPDPRAHYKLMGISMGVAVAKSLDEYYKKVPSPFKPSMAAHIVGGGLVGGALITGAPYCIGLLLTKIASKDAF